MSDKSDDSKVGPGHPPRDTLFKKGHPSPNPKGPQRIRGLTPPPTPPERAWPARRGAPAHPAGAPGPGPRPVGESGPLSTTNTGAPARAGARTTTGPPPGAAKPGSGLRNPAAGEC